MNYDPFLIFVSDEDEDDAEDDDRSSIFSTDTDWWFAFNPFATVNDVSRSSSSGLVKASSRPAIVINSPKLDMKERVDVWMKFEKNFTVLIEENQEISEIFEMYFPLLHKIDLVVVVLNHFLLKSNPQNTSAI